MNDPDPDFMDTFQTERRRAVTLSDEQILEIAKVAVKLAKTEMEEEGYQGWKKQIATEIGNTVIDKLRSIFAWAIGASFILLYYLLDKYNLLSKT
jgi:hypothetical protein